MDLLSSTDALLGLRKRVQHHCRSEMAFPPIQDVDKRLFYACDMGDFYAAEEAIKDGADVNVHCDDGVTLWGYCYEDKVRTPLLVACRRFVVCLFAQGPNPATCGLPQVCLSVV